MGSRDWIDWIDELSKLLGRLDRQAILSIPTSGILYKDRASSRIVRSSVLKHFHSNLVSVITLLVTTYTSEYRTRDLRQSLRQQSNASVLLSQ